jgi:hypothetical protein
MSGLLPDFLQPLFLAPPIICSTLHLIKQPFALFYTDCPLLSVLAPKELKPVVPLTIFSNGTFYSFAASAAAFIFTCSYGFLSTTHYCC